jgi:antirestriction protein ArdC
MIPYNATTAVPYAGKNITVLLAAMAANDWTDPRFLTEIQSLAFGTDVMRLRIGSVGIPLVKVIGNKRRRRRKDDEDEDEERGGLNHFVVYHVSQFENWPTLENTDPRTLKYNWHDKPRLDVEVAREIATECLSNRQLYPSEIGFVQEMTETESRPSPPQGNWLLKIYARAPTNAIS